MSPARSALRLILLSQTLKKSFRCDATPECHTRLVRPVFRHWVKVSSFVGFAQPCSAVSAPTTTTAKVSAERTNNSFVVRALVSDTSQ